MGIGGIEIRRKLLDHKYVIIKIKVKEELFLGGILFLICFQLLTYILTNEFSIEVRRISHDQDDFSSTGPISDSLTSYVYPAVDTKISGFIWYIIVTGHTDFTVHCLLFTATRIPRSFTVHSHSLHAGQGQVKDMDKDKDCSSVLHYSALNCLLHIAHASNTGPYLSCLSSFSMTEK